MAENERYFTLWCVVLCILVCWSGNVKGQGAGPIGGSVADYYDQAFGNPFLGYWKNPGNKYPYGSHTVYTDPNLAYGGQGLFTGRGSPYGSPYATGLDRPAPAVPTYLYNRLGPAAYATGGYPDPYMSMGYGAGMGGYGMGGVGYGGGYSGVYPGAAGVGSPLNDVGRTPADRGLQDLLPSSYAYKPWYP